MVAMSLYSHQYWLPTFIICHQILSNWVLLLIIVILFFRMTSLVKWGFLGYKCSSVSWLTVSFIGLRQTKSLNKNFDFCVKKKKVFYLTPAVLSVSKGRCYYCGVPCSASLCHCPVLLWVNQVCFHSGNLVWILMILSQWRYWAASIRPGTRFDLTSSQFMWTVNENKSKWITEV